jgi:hypothetical protein
MPAHRVNDPLVRLNIRVPKSLHSDLLAQATAAGVTMSDVFRSHLTLESVKPLGVPVKHKRVVQTMASARCTAPALLRSLAAIGSNLNQIARAVNAGSITGDMMQGIEMLAILHAIEREFAVLIASNRGPVDAH